MEMRVWQELGVVDTIYEDDQEEEEEEEKEEEEEDRFNSRSSSLQSSRPPPSSLRSIVEGWSRKNGCKTDIIIRIQDQSFHLHRHLITSRSGYLERHLTESSDVTIAPPSGLTADSFADVISSCYGSNVALTPSNLAALRATADWLEMTDDDGGGGGYGGLVSRTDDYFFQEVATDAGQAAHVLRGCAALLGGEAAGSAARLIVRCVEVLEGSGGDEGWLDDVAALSVEEMVLVAEAMRARFEHDHDLLYRIVDHYLEKHKGKISEDDKTRLCHSISSTNLSHHHFMHLIQNPRLPLRFVVQAMLVEQLHAHRSLFHHAAAATTTATKHPDGPHLPLANPANPNVTLGTILRRDAVVRQSAHIRASMEATSFRIESLERELRGLRRRLRRSEEKEIKEKNNAAIDSVRSASFRIVREKAGGEDMRDEKNGRGFGAKLVRGLKSMFSRNRECGSGADHQAEGCGVGEVKEKRPGHRKNRSFG